MCSVCSPPSLPNPNWGALTSWPELNWVVVPVASVSFPVSQGGLHSHCVRHFIVQAGCNQADESRISRNTLRAFFFKCLRSAARYPHTQTETHQICGNARIKAQDMYGIKYMYLCTYTLPKAAAFDGFEKVQASATLPYSSLLSH